MHCYSMQPYRYVCYISVLIVVCCQMTPSETGIMRTE